jgi:hypothetical protein
MKSRNVMTGVQTILLINNRKRRIKSVIVIFLLPMLSSIGPAVFTGQTHAEIGRSEITGNPSLQLSSNTATQKSILEAAVPGDYVTLSEFKTYNADNLYEEIDGKAPLYIDSGFVQLAIQRFAHKKNENLWMEISIFDMADPRNAFSILSVQRGPETYPLSIVNTSYGYKTGNALYFVHGRYYIEIVGSSESNELSGVMTATARNIQADLIIDKAVEIPQLNLFPRENLIEGSIKLHLTNAFGFDGLEDIFACRYNFRGQAITAFLSECSNAGIAEGKADSYYEFLTKNGAKDKTTASQFLKDNRARVLDFYKTIEIVFTVGPIMGGIHEADNQQAAEDLAGILIKNLTKEASAK